MKKILLSIPLALLLFAACRKANNPTVFDLGVDVQGGFEKDHVQVYIDNQPLLNTEVTTSPLLGLATSISTANTEGLHTIRVIVNGNIEKTEKFAQPGDLYIGISYNKTTATVSCNYSEHQFLYY
ncbi:hypothetical protein [Longitalea luteola]|uniref:hypothetical protein n=1 Tax=Longitalea luteola TaxID=2812563 RepID=UPI001A95F141|nr:hypothetical protein [Longitalea luteola]